MNVLITQAIREGRLLRLTYQYQARTIEPHVLGLTKDRREALLCRQLQPLAADGEGWRLFYLAGISNLRMLDDRFAAPPEEMLPPVEHFSATYAILQP
ncbi:MAG TPA: WYL domain-containing protein [Rhodocyclaceae bacterium]|nr:WYL domain-containing protein [Rhodocyclaceae bacterium]